MQYTLVLINRIQRLATLYMIFEGSALKKKSSSNKILFNTKHHILVNCSKQDLLSCTCIGGNCYIHISTRTNL